MTTTEHAREAWNDLIKEMYAETGVHVDPNMAGVRLQMRYDELLDTVADQGVRLMEQEQRLKAVGAW